VAKKGSEIPYILLLPCLSIPSRVSQTSLNLSILLPQPPKCWDFPPPSVVALREKRLKYGPGPYKVLRWCGFDSQGKWHTQQGLRKNQYRW
jgi:hypothetical protein